MNFNVPDKEKSQLFESIFHKPAIIFFIVSEVSASAEEPVAYSILKKATYFLRVFCKLAFYILKALSLRMCDGSSLKNSFFEVERILARNCIVSFYCYAVAS